ncbi:MAG TPA: hypothetical protein VJ885_01455 [Thermoanaerobaculia bacterium]|nr:hypothetical protein [Thermoanaerobaculia bacterium]
MARQSITRQARRLRAEAGFSFIEVVIASLLLLMISVAILPLFTEAAASNEVGREYTEVSNFAKSRAEQFMQLSFNSEPLTITTGTQRLHEEHYSKTSKKWVNGLTVTPGDQALWIRRTTVRQFGVNDLDTLTNPLPAGTPPEGIHIKEIAVEVRGANAASLFGPTKNITVRALKAQ